MTNPNVLRICHNSRTPQGVRGLKYDYTDVKLKNTLSHSARSAWIEMLIAKLDSKANESHSARSAWIEMSSFGYVAHIKSVALRKECVD